MGLLQFSFIVAMLVALLIAMGKIRLENFLSGGFVLAKVFNTFSSWLWYSGVLSSTEYHCGGACGRRHRYLIVDKAGRKRQKQEREREREFQENTCTHTFHRKYLLETYFLQLDTDHLRFP